jgi:hypothetical protein
LHFAESALGVVDGFKTPMVINAAAAIFSSVSTCIFLPVPEDYASALQLQLALSAFGVKDGLRTPNAMRPATATLSNVSIFFSLNGRHPAASLPERSYSSPLLGPPASNQK